MGKFLLKFSVLTVLLLSALNCFADFTQDGITYENKDGYLMVKHADYNLSGEVIVPETIDGCPVRKVLGSAFSGCYNITSIRFTFDKNSPDYHYGIWLDNYAFNECYNLTKVVIPMLNVAFTDDNAFFGLPSECTVVAGLSVMFGQDALAELGLSPAQFKFLCEREVDSTSIPSNVSVIKTALDIVSRDFTTVVVRPTADPECLSTGIWYNYVWYQGQDTYTLDSENDQGFWAGFNVDGYELFNDMEIPWIEINKDSLTYSVEATKSSLRFYNINFNNEGYSPSTYDLVINNNENVQPVIDGEVMVTNLDPVKKYSFRICAMKKDGTRYRDISWLEGTTKDWESTVTFSKEATPTTIRLTVNINEAKDEKVDFIDYFLRDKGITSQGKKISDKGGVQKWVISGLMPDKFYDYIHIVYDFRLKDRDESTAQRFVDVLYISTPDIELSTLPAKVVSATSAIVAASTNLDFYDSGTVETGVEWRKLDAPASLASNVGVAPVSDGMIEGFVKNLQPTYYKFRPYCRYVDSGETVYKYGDWVTFDQTDISYFEPSVRTYAEVITTCNTAVLRGYALAGSDNIIGQGFELWRKGSYNVPVRIPAVLSAPSGDSNLITLEASGQIMEAQATDLAPDTEYAFRAYVKTDTGTFYGDEQSFTTDSDTGIDIITDADKEPVVIGIYDLTGHQVVGDPKGVVIIRYSDGTVRKAIGGIR